MTVQAELWDAEKLVCVWNIPSPPPLGLKKLVYAFAPSPYRHTGQEPVLQSFVLNGQVAAGVYQYDRDE